MNKYDVSVVSCAQYGRLRLRAGQSINKSADKVWWQCECGGSKLVRVGSVVNGLTKSCGCLFKEPTGRKWIKPTLIAKSTWLAHIPQLIDSDLPEAWPTGYTKQCTFKCRCGAEYTRRFVKWIASSTCGNCNMVNIADLRGNVYGDLRLTDVRDLRLHVGSDTKVEFECLCGNRKLIGLGHVLRTGVGKRGPNTTSCGKCGKLSADWWLSQSFGHLRVLKCDESIGPHSMRKLRCKCSCGTERDYRADWLAQNRVRTCGNCRAVGIAWWGLRCESRPLKLNGGYTLQTLSAYFDGCPIQPLSGCANGSVYMPFKCTLCDSEFKTKLNWVCNSKISSCGCTGFKISRGVIELAAWLREHGCAVELEAKVDGHSYDMLVNGKLLIEYHGLRYHSTELRDSRVVDRAKYVAAARHYKYMMIYADESTNVAILDSILSAAGARKCVAVRPQSCVVREVSYSECVEFYNTNHYLGAAPSKLHIGTFHAGRLVACMSLRAPSRQSTNYKWEIARMASVPDLRVHGLWSYLLARLRNFGVHGAIVTFSDNRLHTGAVYASMGMKHDGDIPQDYYWVKSNKRKHKSAMRKSANERLGVLTESELRAADGWHKIYDVGKKRWLIVL